jgi:hypothetical protein
MAKKLSICGANEPEIVTPDPNAILKITSQRQNRGRVVQTRKTFRESISFDLQGSRAREVLVQEDDPMDTFVV